MSAKLLSVSFLKLKPFILAGSTKKIQDLAGLRGVWCNFTLPIPKLRVNKAPCFILINFRQRRTVVYNAQLSGVQLPIYSVLLKEVCDGLFATYNQ